MESDQMMRYAARLINRVLKNKKGMSLVEVMVVIAVTGIITAAVGMFMVSNQQSANLTQNMIDIQMQGEQALKLISEKVIEAGAVIEKTNGREYWMKGIGTGGKYTYHCFRFDRERQRLLYAAVDTDSDLDPVVYNVEDSSFSAAAQFIRELDISPMLLGDAAAPNYNGAAIKLVFVKNGVNKTYGTQVYCRNWPLQ